MKTIGKFQVVEKIGEGGFGVIYKGLDPHIKRHVAIKSCTSSDEAVRSRFVQEAQISGNLHHRHIVTVYDFGVEEGVPYLVQEYLNGEDLDRKIKRRDFIPFPEKLLYLMQIARGLQYAHSQGVVHRDIKPANLRILEDGTAKIMDFGIAKLTNQETGLTQTGMTLGTAAYLAPEQIRGEPVDPRTDIFAYGATAYELLTYRRPFVGQHISTVLYQILNEEPPKVSTILPDVPPELDELVQRCIEKDISKRYKDVGELLRDLDRLLKKRRTEITTKSIDPPTAKVPQPAGEVDDHKTVVSDSLAPASSPPGPESAGGLEPSVQSAPTSGSQGAPVTATVAASTAATKTAPVFQGASSAELHDIELDGTGETSLTPHGINASQILQRRQFQWGPWAAGVVLFAAIALGVYSYFDNRGFSTDRTEGAESTLELTPGETDGPLSSAGEASENASDQTTSPNTNLATATDGADGGSNSPADTNLNGSRETEIPSSEATDELATEAAPPANGTLRIPPAWSPSMTVQVDGKTYTLDQAHSLELPPGSYDALFRLKLDTYDDSARRSIEITSEGDVSLSIPIRPPGLLDVQPLLSSPQKGYVYLGRTLLGPSPVRGRQLKPGQYTLRVVPDLGDDQPGIETPITIGSGGKLIVTFDLATGNMIQRDATTTN